MTTKRKLRKQLSAELADATFNALCGVQYHTSNLPEHAGYIIKDSDAMKIRHLSVDLQRLKRKK